MSCIPPRSCTPFIGGHLALVTCPLLRRSSDHGLPVTPALLRSISRCRPVARGAQDSAIPLCCPRHAPPPHPASRLQTRVRRRADQSLHASDRVLTCTRLAEGQGPATDNTSTVCRQRGYAPWGYSPPPPYARPVDLHNLA